METGSSPFGNLHDAFEQPELNRRAGFYKHPDEARLLYEMKDTLSQSDTGARLLQLVNDQGIKIHVVKGTVTQSFVDGIDISITAAPGMDLPEVSQVLELGGAIREVEQYLVGFIVDNSMDPLTRANMTHAKFLDKIVFMCKIGSELEKELGNLPIKAIEAFGFGDIYQAYLSEAGQESAKDVYIKTFSEPLEERE